MPSLSINAYMGVGSAVGGSEGVIGVSVVGLKEHRVTYRSKRSTQAIVHSGLKRYRRP